MAETGLSTPPDIFGNVSPLDTMAVKLILSNIPPFFTSEEIGAALRLFGTVLSRISMIPLRLHSDASVCHVISFQPHCSIVLSDNLEAPGAVLTLKDKINNYQIYIGTETPICFICGVSGHLKNICPKNNYSGISRLLESIETNSGPSRVEGP